MGKFLDGQEWSDPNTWRAADEDDDSTQYWGLTSAEWDAQVEAGGETDVR